MRWSGYSFNVSPREMPKRIIASIFWGFYESAEIRLLNKYFKGDSDVIECGASSGIVSAFITVDAIFRLIDRGALLCVANIS